MDRANFEVAEYTVVPEAEVVSGGMFRSSAMITKDGRRLERSGLIGPRFDDEASARQYAVDWANRWIETHASFANGGIGELSPDM
ncbi:MAG: hypothetical protein ACRYG5_09270 [Janthinobacterium lividum]